MLFRNPQLFAYLMIAVGLGLLAWHGEQWYRLPEWSQAEIEQSIELNLAIELQRMGLHLQPSGERLDRLRSTIGSELKGEIRREREKIERWLGVGLLLIVLGAGQTLVAPRPRDSQNAP